MEGREGKGGNHVLLPPFTTEGLRERWREGKRREVSFLIHLFSVVL